MKHLIATLLAAASLSAAQGKQTFTGTITDSECGNAGHAVMRMGPTDAECTRMCVMAHAAAYVLLDGKTVYTLSDQKRSEEFAGRKVRIVGTLDAGARTIHVDSIAAQE
jgi:hypothetical protein